jgi:hypothetical protein
LRRFSRFERLRDERRGHLERPRPAVPDDPRKAILKMATLSAFTKNNLNRLGFASLNDEAKSRYALPLRFTPAFAVVLIGVGLALRSPIWLGAFSLVALSGALFPRWMILDLFHNLVVRHLFHAQALPATPTPRRYFRPCPSILVGRCWDISWAAWWLSGPQSWPRRSGAWGRFLPADFQERRAGIIG